MGRFVKKFAREMQRVRSAALRNRKQNTKPGNKGHSVATQWPRA